VTTVLVLACPGRERITRATLDALAGIGGARQLPDARLVIWWVGEEPPPRRPSPEWTLVHTHRKPLGHRHDYWAALAFADDLGGDLVIMEDDVQPCTNAVPYMARYQSPHLTTFCNLRRSRPGIYSADGFHGTQAIKFPERLLERVVQAGPDSQYVMHSPHNGDTRLAHLLIAWGERVNHHRSLVQHVGDVSLCMPGAKLRGNGRAPVSDWDQAFDPTNKGGTND
jgi:hypothetical protein